MWFKKKEKENLVKQFFSSYIHLLDQKTLFNQIHTFFHPNLAISSILVIEIKKLWPKKITFIWQKVDIYFEMVQSCTMVPRKRVDSHHCPLNLICQS